MTTPAPPGRSPSTRLLLVAVLLAAVAGAGGLWYLFLRPAAPAAVTDSTAAPTVRAAASASTAADATVDAGPGASATSVGSGTAPAAGDLSGTWTVNPAIGKFSDFSGSFVGYRVQEQLASIGANTAVGRTPDVSGTFTLDRTSVTAAQFTAKLTGLVSDDRGRDGRVQDALNTRQTPTTTFLLSSPIAMGDLPADGQDVTVTAAGRLTIRGVTRDVQFPLTARRSGATLTVKGALEIRFADFSIPKPTSFSVLSIADTGIVEVQLQLTRA